MPTNNTFTSTKEEWKRLADIDYFGMYVKAYIPFNAWMNLNFPEASDRAKINTIKRESNIFRNKIVALLQDDSQDGADFRARLGELHNTLEQAQIYNQGRVISFRTMRFKNEGRHFQDEEKRGIIFHVHCGDAGHPFEGKTVLSIKGHKRLGGETTHFFKEFPEYEYDKTAVLVSLSQLNNQAWRQEILFLYQSIAPMLEIDLVSGAPNKEGKETTSVECGRFYFVPDAVKVAQGLIEVLYNLRNALFHGEINPNGDANKVYGAAYRLLRRVIECL